MAELTTHQLKQQKQKELSEQARLEHEERQAALKVAEEERRKKRRIIRLSVTGAVLIIFLLILWPIVSYYALPGSYDVFAKCLTAKGAVMYGADFCKFTQGQRAMFGRSMKHINYQDFTKGPDIKKTPTWIIGDERLENAQSFEKLAAVTGCAMPK